MSHNAGVQFPREFKSIIRNQIGSEYIQFLEAHNNFPTKSVRLNALKGMQPQSGWIPISWCESGFIIREKKSFAEDPLFHCGSYYVQEPSSMFLDYVVRCLIPELGGRSFALDLCAAPGGKTLILADALPPGSLVISNELVKKRRLSLEHNIIKWGRENIMLTQSDPSRFHGKSPLFDLVLIDAPCSGEGLFRKKPSLAGQWSQDRVRHCSLRQRRILNNSLSVIREGGFLIYSTCTYNDQENMEQIKWLIEADFESVSIPLPPDSGIIKRTYGKGIGYQFYPHLTEGEGFFIAVLRKKTPQEPHEAPRHRSLEPSWTALDLKHLEEFLPIAKAYQHLLWTDKNNNVFCLDKQWREAVTHLSRTLNPTPIFLGSIRERIFVPSHALALSKLLNPDISKIHLDLTSSRKYLRKENLNIANPIPGWHIATFNGIPLGWLKGLGKRYNNYYPTRYRIQN